MRTFQESFNNGIPIFQHRGIITLPGGYQILTTGLTLYSVIPAGTPVLVDDAARTIKVIKSASVFANATNVATAIQVAKGHPFVIGDFITKGVGVASKTISSIDTTPTDHDVLNLDATLGYALNAGDALVAAAAEAGAAVVDAPTGLLYEDRKVVPNVTGSVAVAGQVYIRRVPVPVTAAHQAALNKFIFLNSK